MNRNVQWAKRLDTFELYTVTLTSVCVLGYPDITLISSFLYYIYTILFPSWLCDDTCIGFIVLGWAAARGISSININYKNNETNVGLT